LAPKKSAEGNPVLIAEIGAAHGVRGDVRVKAYTADPEAIGDYGPLSDDQGRTFEIRTMRPLKGDLLVVSFAGVADRTAAEKLNRTRLYVDRSALPEPEDEEFYHADLLGLPVQTTAGDVVGRIVAVPNFGADDLLEVIRPDGRSVFVPFTRAVVPVVDLAARTVVIDPPAGLLDDEPTAPVGDGPDGAGGSAEER
jgi:16S rRNA processing protein RimM